MESKDIPGVAAPPPLIFFLPVGAAWLVNWLAPLRIAGDGPIWPAGLLFVAGGLALGGMAFGAMRRQRTPVDPYEAPTALVTGGPYRFTRNPIYLGFVLIYLGFTAFMNSLWPLICLPFVLVAVDRLVIAREERWLERKFGEDYRAYKAAVRRWL